MLGQAASKVAMRCAAIELDGQWRLTVTTLV
jgi:hypothetical protein